MTYKILPAPSKSNRQVREYTEAVEKGFRSVFVRPSIDGWRVVLVNNYQLVGVFTNKNAAVQAAKKKAASINGNYFVFNKSGQLVEIK